MRYEKFGSKRKWSWFDFGLAKLGALTFFALVAKLVNKWIYGFCAILVGNCHKCLKNDVWKVWSQKELILVGFWLSHVRWIGFFFPWLQNWWISEVMVFVQSRWGIVTNASKMRCEKFRWKRNWSWLVFGLAKFGWLAFFPFVAKLVNKWTYGFCASLEGNCHKFIKNEV